MKGLITIISSLLLAGTLQAADQYEQPEAGVGVEVETYADGFMVYQHQSGLLQVRIWSETEELIFSYEGDDRDVEALLPGDIRDGVYKYEVIQVDPTHAEGQKTAREFGYFTVLDGEILIEIADANSLSWLPKLLEPLMETASAQAIGDLHDGPGFVRILYSEPAIGFDDNSTGQSSDWYIRGNNDFFGLHDGYFEDPVFRIFPKNSAGSTDNMLVVEGDGDLSLVDGNFMMDRFSRLGIGTQTPSADLHISDITPVVRIDETDASQIWDIRSSFSTFSVFDVTGGRQVFTIEDGAGSNALRLESTGDVTFNAGQVGVGVADPLYDLHISSFVPGFGLTDESDGETFRIYYNGNAVRFQKGGSIATPLLIAEDAGNNLMSLVGSTVNIGGGDLNVNNGRLTTTPTGIGMGTTNPLQDLHILKDDATLRLDDTTSGSGYADLQMAAGQLNLRGTSSNSFFKADVTAPADGIVLQNTGQVSLANGTMAVDGSLGRVGIGTGTPSSELEIVSPEPELWLTDDTDGQSARLDYSADVFKLFLNNGGSPSQVMTLAEGAPGNSFRANQTNVSMANLHVFNATGDVGIGTAVPLETLDMRAIDPAIRFGDEATGNAMTLEYSNNFLRIKGKEGQDIGKMNGSAPLGTFTTDAKGRTGYGTANPAASLNIKYRSAHGSVPVLLIQRPNDDEIFKVNFNGDTTINGAVVHSSDRNAKTAIVPVDTQSILEKVTQLPISQWQYKASEGTDHIGPMAQDFHAAFGLGNTDTGIATVDLDGVALASIQALAEENRQLKQAHREVLKALHAKADRLQRLEAVVAELAADSAEPVLTAAR